MAYRWVGVLGLDVRLEFSPSHCGASIFDHRRCHCHDRTAGLSNHPSEGRPIGQRLIGRFERMSEERPLSFPYRPFR